MLIKEFGTDCLCLVFFSFCSLSICNLLTLSFWLMPLGSWDPYAFRGTNKLGWSKARSNEMWWFHDTVQRTHDTRIMTVMLDVSCAPVWHDLWLIDMTYISWRMYLGHLLCTRTYSTSLNHRLAAVTDTQLRIGNSLLVCIKTWLCKPSFTFTRSWISKDLYKQGRWFYENLTWFCGSERFPKSRNPREIRKIIDNVDL